MKSIEKGLDFDDVLLIPEPSVVNSRSEVNLERDLAPFLKLQIPIIASPMKGIASPELVASIGILGGVGILHRFIKEDKVLGDQLEFIQKETPNFGMAVGLDDRRYQLGLDLGCKIVCVDVANGYTRDVLNFINELALYVEQNKYECLVMGGNVCTLVGAIDLANAGAKLIRVGIGGGNLCTTRNVTGVGVPQITALLECKLIPYTGVSIVADGGIRNSGDAVKALAAGGDVVMMGSLFGHCFESSHNGIIYGMASRRLQEEYYHNTKSVEGIEQEMEKNISLEAFLDEFLWGMKSAFTYLNSSTITDLHINSHFIEIGRSSLKQL